MPLKSAVMGLFSGMAVFYQNPNVLSTRDTPFWAKGARKSKQGARGLPSVAAGGIQDREKRNFSEEG